MTAPTRAPRPKSSWAWLLLAIVALIYGAMATFGKDTGDITAGPQTITVDATARGGQRVTFENVIPDTIPTCSDSGFPNTRTTCFTASELLDRPGGGTRWGLLALAVAIGVAGLLGFAQMLPWQKKTAATPSSYLLVPLAFVQDSLPGPIPMTEGRDSWYLLAIVVGVAVIIGGVVWFVKRKNGAAT